MTLPKIAYSAAFPRSLAPSAAPLLILVFSGGRGGGEEDEILG